MTGDAQAGAVSLDDLRGLSWIVDASRRTRSVHRLAELERQSRGLARSCGRAARWRISQRVQEIFDEQRRDFLGG